jgi:hypothetical protein
MAMECARRPEESSGVIDAAICHGATGVGLLLGRVAGKLDSLELQTAADRWFEKALDITDAELSKHIAEPRLKKSATPLRGLRQTRARCGCSSRINRPEMSLALRLPLAVPKTVRGRKMRCSRRRYSARSEMFGSERAAQYAGITLAAMETAKSMRPTPK